VTAPLGIAADRLRFVDLTPAGGDLLARFHDELYVPEFPEPDERESLDNMLAYLRAGDHANAYLVTLLLDGDRIVGGCVADYFARSSCGAIEFLVVDPAARGSGVGGRLAAHIERRMHGAAQERGKTLALVLAEINDPFKRSPTPDNVDPFVRLRFWARLGFRRLAFPYRQPALSDRQAPVENLLLAAKSAGSVHRTSVPAALVGAFLRDYLIYAMRIADPSASLQFTQMAAFLAGREAVGLADLEVYAGNDPRRPLNVQPVERPSDDDFAAAMAVYRRAFPDPSLAIPQEAFAAHLQARRANTAYHLWAVRASARDPVAGLASFFGLAHAGFGGYVAFADPLGGSGRLRLLLARIERRLVADSHTTRGWYIECAARVAPIFERCGFYRVALTYGQPALHVTQPQAVSFPLSLLYKEFGACYGPPRVDAPTFAAAMAEIETDVYGLEPAGGASLFTMPAKYLAFIGDRNGFVSFVP
jgi:GNAT superfamily N-acetyltransferase